MVEKEAIEIMNHWIEYEKQNKDKINRAEELIEIQETILDIIKRKDKEIEYLKIEIEEAWEEWNNLEIGSYEEEKRLNLEINKNDKIITEMAKKINEAYCQENSFFIWFEENFGIRNEGDYSKEIKNYFNGKVVS